MYNGSGAFTVDTAGNPVVTQTSISSTVFNSTMQEMATGLSTAICKDGQTTITQNLPMSNHKFTGMLDGSARADSATIGNIVDGTGVYVGTVGGTADVITLTPNPAITAYVAGQTFRFIASGANTTNVTVAVSGLAAKAITKNGTTALVAGDIPASMMVEITYDGTRFILGTLGGSLIQSISGTIIDAKGDLIVGTADNTTARLPVGSDGAFLQADSVASGGISWVTLNSPPSFLQNAVMQVNQRQGSTVADDTYCIDRWYVLTQTGSITYSQQTLQENGQAQNVRLTQTQAVAQRIGFATILEARDSQWQRGQALTLRPRVRVSNSQPIRMAVLEWTGTADTVTSDVVLNWTNGTFTAGNFFLAANLAITGVSVATTPTANTWTDMAPLTVTVGSSCNNLIVFLWSEGTMAQNVTFDIGKVRLVPGGYKGDIYIPSFAETLAVTMRTYQKSFAYATAPAQNVGLSLGGHTFDSVVTGAAGQRGIGVRLAPMRGVPIIVLFNPQAANAQLRNVTRSQDATSTTVPASGLSERGFTVQATMSAATSPGDHCEFHWTAEGDL